LEIRIKHKAKAMNNENTKSKSHEVKVVEAQLSAIDINIIYSLMLMRISKGLTPGELDFLIGSTETTIRDIEDFNLKSIGLEIVWKVVTAIEGGDIQGIIFSPLDSNDRFSKYKLVRSKNEQTIETAVYALDSMNSENLVFKLFEQNTAYEKFPQAISTTLNEIRGLLNLMLDGAAFIEPLTPLEIYQKCRIILGNEVYPRYVEMILAEMTKKRGYPKLARRKIKRTGKIVYEKADRFL
jgi:hypothetical protein